MWGRSGAVLSGALLAAVVAMPAAAAERHQAVLEGARFKLPPVAGPTLEAHLAAAPAVARRLARLAAPQLTFRLARGSHDRAHGVPVAGGGLRFVVELRPRSLKPTAVGRFVFLHELGHVVDWAFVDDDLRARFGEAFRTSPRWLDCFPLGDGCVPEAEVFAEQFAFWAGGRRTLRSGYRVPPLLSRASFGRLMEAAGWSPASPLGMGR